MLTQAARDKVISHALDHVAYRWAKGLPVRHDRREWTEEEIDLYNKTYDEQKYRVNQNPPLISTCFNKYLPGL